MNTYPASLSQRIKSLEKEKKKQAGQASQADCGVLRVAPSCPPDKRIRMQGGRGTVTSGDTFSAYKRRVYDVPSLIADLADPTSIGRDINFATAGYYQAFVLLLAPPAVVESPTDSDWSFRLEGSTSEFATAAEAEADMEEQAMWQLRPWAHIGWKGTPLCGLVLRNDGATGSGGHMLAVELINRGRSYIWPTDLRPRWTMGW